MIGTIAVTLEDVTSVVSGVVALYEAEVLSDSPDAYWRLGESAGTTAVDSSLNSSPGVYTAGFTLGATSLVPSEADTAVDFAVGRVAIASTTDIDDVFASGGTIEGWINPDTFTAGAATVFNKEDGTDGWGLQLTTDGRLTFFQLGTVVGAWESTSPTITLGTTFHFAVTYDNSGFPTSNAIVYINGLEAVTTELLTPSGTTAGDAGLPAAIAQRVATTFPFDGVVDDVSLHKTILTPARILARFHAGVGTVAGTITPTLDDVSSTITGSFSLPVTGTIAVPLDDVSSAIQGAIEVTGTISETLDDVASVMSGMFAQVFTGTVAVTLENVSPAIQGVVEVTGTISETLDNVSSVISGVFVQLVTGTIAETLEDVSSVMSGVFIGQPTGTIAVTLDDVTSVISGTAIAGVSGTIVVTLEDASSVILGTFSQAVSGTISITLDDVSSVMSGTVPIPVTLTWQDNSNNELEFRIYRRDVPAINFVQVGTVAADATTFAQVLSAGSYEYKVSARNVLGETFSNTASIIIA